MGMAHLAQLMGRPEAPLLLEGIPDQLPPEKGDRPHGEFGRMCALKPENAGRMASWAAYAFSNQAPGAIHVK